MTNNKPRREIAKPTNDIAFKKLFANPNDTFVLVDFLNAVLEPEYKMTVGEVTLVESINLPDGNGGKLSAYDVHCVDKTGRNFIVEMQVLGTGWSKQRAQWYVSQVYYKQLEESEEYEKAQPVFLIAILGFDMFKNHDRYISYHTVRDTVDNQKYLDGFNFAFIELKKFKKQAIETLNSKMALWCTFFNQYFNDELIDSLCEKSAAINRAAKVLEMHNWDRKERDAYEKLKLIAHDRILVAEFAEKQSEEWIRKAEETIKNKEETIKNKEETIKNKEKTIEMQAQELALAKEKALLAEHQTKLEMAKRLLKTGMSAKDVATLTELDEKDLENL